MIIVTIHLPYLFSIIYFFRSTCQEFERNCVSCFTRTDRKSVRITCTTGYSPVEWTGGRTSYSSWGGRSSGGKSCLHFHHGNASNIVGACAVVAMVGASSVLGVAGKLEAQRPNIFLLTLWIKLCTPPYVQVANKIFVRENIWKNILLIYFFIYLVSKYKMKFRTQYIASINFGWIKNVDRLFNIINLGNGIHKNSVKKFKLKIS